MTSIQDAFYLDGKPYSELSNENKKIIDSAVQKLKVWEQTILSFNDTVLNIITEHPKYSLLIQSEFPDDLTGKMIYAYTQSKS